MVTVACCRTIWLHDNTISLNPGPRPAPTVECLGLRAWLLAGGAYIATLKGPRTGSPSLGLLWGPK